MAMIDILITTILPFVLITMINILIAYKLKTETKKAKKCKKQTKKLRLSKNESKNYIYANGYPIIYNNPLPQPHPAQVVIAPVPAPVVPVVPVGPYPVQQPIVSAQGDVIVENTIGGIPFDCRGRPTGHWRDTRFCDIFHACVHGYQRKTYACPIVGERTYFDEITKRCEFISKNPLGCTVNVFLK
jgi:hypothetical protein